MELLNDKKYGVKVCVISTMDYNDFKEILDLIQSKGYTITIVDNGNAVCERENEGKEA